MSIPSQLRPLLTSQPSLIAFLPLLLLILIATPTHAESRYIEVSGSAEATAYPDYLMLQLQMNTSEATLAEARDRLAEDFHTLMERTDALGIEQSWIEAEQIRNFPRYQWQDGARIRVSEDVSRSVSIRLYDLDDYDQLVTQLMSIDSVQLQNTQFGFRNPDLLAEQARKQAVLNARNKALQMAATLDVELGEPLHLREISEQAPPMLARSMAAEKASPMRMLVSEQSVSARVEVRFAIQ